MKNGKMLKWFNEKKFIVLFVVNRKKKKIKNPKLCIFKKH